MRKRFIPVVGLLAFTLCMGARAAAAETLGCANPAVAVRVCSGLESDKNDAWAEKLVANVVVCVVPGYGGTTMKIQTPDGRISKPLDVVSEDKVGVSTYTARNQEFAFRLTVHFIHPKYKDNSDFELKSLQYDDNGQTYTRAMHCD